MEMQPAVAPTKPSASLRWFMTLVGLGILGVAVTLYLTGASRAIAVWITPVALAVGAVGVASLRGAAVPGWVLVLLGVVAAALLILGLATWIYATVTPTTSA
jgi:hypothetical protein